MFNTQGVGDVDSDYEQCLTQGIQPYSDALPKCMLELRTARQEQLGDDMSVPEEKKSIYGF